MRADIVGFDRNGDVKLVAEVKNRRGVSKSWAATFRRNLLAHSEIPSSAFFLLIFPDQLHLWKPGVAANVEQKPDVTAQVPEGFFSHSGSTTALEFSTFGWLSHLTRLTATEGLKKDPFWTWATNSGLADSLEGGRVELEPPL